MQNALTAIMGALSIASWIRMRKINFAFNNTKIKQTDSSYGNIANRIPIYCYVFAGNYSYFDVVRL